MGTFNILFDDGERFSKVDAKRIRSLQPKSEKKPNRKEKKIKVAMTRIVMATKSKLHGRQRKTQKT